MAKQPTPKVVKQKSFLADMTAKLGSGLHKIDSVLSASKPIGTSGRYGTVAPVVKKKR